MSGCHKVLGVMKDDGGLYTGSTRPNHFERTMLSGLQKLTSGEYRINKVSL